jgi:hypothetical protein
LEGKNEEELLRTGILFVLWEVGETFFFFFFSLPPLHLPAFSPAKWWGSSKAVRVCGADRELSSQG